MKVLQRMKNYFASLLQIISDNIEKKTNFKVKSAVMDFMTMYKNLTVYMKREKKQNEGIFKALRQTILGFNMDHSCSSPIYYKLCESTRIFFEKIDHGFVRIFTF